MRDKVSLYTLLLFLFAASGGSGMAASKPHVLSFGKWIPVQLLTGPAEDKAVDVRVRPLYVDGVLKEFTVGEPHEVTDRSFVIRRAFRLNDSLPGDKKAQRWIWRFGDWLLVNRASGRIAQVPMPVFHPFYSEVTWYRDYAAYCGISDSGDTVYAIVVQVGARKPVLKKELGPAVRGGTPEGECEVPQWERQPSRVTFIPRRFPRLTYTVFARSADISPDDPGD